MYVILSVLGICSFVYMWGSYGKYNVAIAKSWPKINNVRVIVDFAIRPEPFGILGEKIQFKFYKIYIIFYNKDISLFLR